MKNRALFLISLLFLSILFFSDVDARTCNYKYDGKDLTLTFSKKDGSEEFEISGCTFAGSDCSGQDVAGYTQILNFVDGSLITDDESCYRSLNVCTLTVKALPPATSLITPLITIIANVTSREKFLGIFGSSLDPATINDAKANEFDVSDIGFWERSFWSNRAVSCDTAVSTDRLPTNQYVHFCDKFVELFSEVRNSYVEFEECGNFESATSNSQKTTIAKCRADALSEVNRTTDNLKTTCNNIMQNASFTSSDGCVQSCLNAVKAVEVLRMQYIGEVNLTSDCSISGRLVLWIANIVKWVKYILPVVVIILGILDFLRAIATNNDDAMKKAQGRFVKRLIAAALVFVVPFILEFILDKMGFSYNGCGIIDL